MRYQGFATRDYFILEHVRLGPMSSVMEIGVGAGSTTERLIGKVKAYAGVDISRETVEQLAEAYKEEPSTEFHHVDACSDNGLDREFDVIFSADTLEHVEDPAAFFRFIARHLVSGGEASVLFPNESEGRRHGVTWFVDKQQLMGAVDGSGLKVTEMLQVKKTVPHALLERILWRLPRAIFKSSRQDKPQTFEDTQAFKIIENPGLVTTIFTLYARAATWVTARFPLYRLESLGGDIRDRIIFLRLKDENE